LPAGLTVATISPRTVHVAYDRRVEKVVEVTPIVAGHPQHGYLVTEVKAIPATIKVRGAEGTLIALSAVRTREVSVEGRAEGFVSETETVLPDGVELEGSPQIVLHVAVDEELVTRKLPGLAVGVRGDGIDPARWQVRPSQVEVTLTGALLAVEKARAALSPTIKLTADTKPREVEVSIEGVPPGIGVRISPERVKVAPAPKNP
jgi:YbbR domain-containing protein